MPQQRAGCPAPRRLPGVAVALGIVLAGAAAPAAPQPGTDPSVLVADVTAELLAAVNEARTGVALQPLSASEPLATVAGRRAATAAASGSLDGSTREAQELSRELRRAGYPPYAWRQRLVQGPRDAAALLRHWRESDPDGFEEVVLGDFEGFGAARIDEGGAPVWSLLFALPRLTWERRQAEPLDDLAAVREGVLSAVNAERRAAGLRALRSEPRLELVAAGHALDMARRGFFDHQSPEGLTPMARVRNGGYAPQRVAENLAKGLFDPAEVVRRWMLSPGHRRNILDPVVREVGIAVVRSERGEEVLPVWVLVLAAPA
jgi:uncharacterized protein YkwD